VKGKGRRAVSDDSTGDPTHRVRLPGFVTGERSASARLSRRRAAISASNRAKAVPAVQRPSTAF